MAASKPTFEQYIYEMIGYKCQTTFWMDFSIADAFGKDAIIDTYKRAFKEWKTNIIYLTELSLILNWKLWHWSENNLYLAKVYNDLWLKLDEWCKDNLKGKDLEYYVKTLD